MCPEEWEGCLRGCGPHRHQKSGSSLIMDFPVPRNLFCVCSQFAVFCSKKCFLHAYPRASYTNSALINLSTYLFIKIYINITGTFICHLLAPFLSLPHQNWCLHHIWLIPFINYICINIILSSIPLNLSFISIIVKTFNITSEIYFYETGKFILPHWSRMSLQVHVTFCSCRCLNSLYSI